MSSTTTSSVPNVAAWRVRQFRDSDNKVSVTKVEPFRGKVPQDQVTLRSIPAVLDEGPLTSKKRYEEVVYNDKTLPLLYRQKIEPMKLHGLGLDKQEAWPGSEVRTLVSQGPLTNRINLTIVGDGYTSQEKDKFFADAQRTTDELFKQDTYQSYLPLFNVHAVFVPSNESGLSDVDQKDTALGLQRDPPGSKRAIMPGKPEEIDRAIALAPATDYPILLANDDFYGGLGGEYAITTRSPKSGIVVLRHELGHNFGDVGEEYDGGSAYLGANHSDTADVPWKQWVEGDTKVYEAKALLGEYPWQNLKEGPVTLPFAVPPQEPGNHDCVKIDGSFVGWETPNDVEITMDGQPQAYQASYTDDRGFFLVGKDACNDLPEGQHTLQVTEKVADGDNVLANVRATAYPAGYDFTPNKVGAFATFDDSGQKVGYRPTHESCLMRDMTTRQFCSIDRENMWHRFLTRVSIIDGVDVTTDHQGPDKTVRSVELRTPPLAGIATQWYKVEADGKETELKDLANQKQWTPDDGTSGQYRVKASLTTPEVRAYDDSFKAQADFSL